MPPGQTAKAKVAKRKFEVAEGDLLTLLNVFNTFKSIDVSSAKHWCSSNFLRFKGVLISKGIFVSIRFSVKYLLDECSSTFKFKFCRRLRHIYFSNGGKIEMNKLVTGN